MDLIVFLQLHDAFYNSSINLASLIWEDYERALNLRKSLKSKVFHDNFLWNKETFLQWDFSVYWFGFEMTFRLIINREEWFNSTLECVWCHMWLKRWNVQCRMVWCQF